MNPDYIRIIAASDEDRRGLFAATARRIGTTEQNVEKDFWVCWALDALFHDRDGGGPRLLFKGGTSLSKAFKLIPRFSEDIDITVFRADLGQDASVEDLEAAQREEASGPARGYQGRMPSLRSWRPSHTTGARVRRRIAGGRPSIRGCGRGRGRGRSRRPDPAHPVPERRGGARQLRSSVGEDRTGRQVRAGPPRRRLDRAVHRRRNGRYGSPGAVGSRRSIRPARSGTRSSSSTGFVDGSSAAVNCGRRVSALRAITTTCTACSESWRTDPSFLANQALAAECVRHARMFFGRPDLDLEHAAPGTFAIVPTPDMRGRLERDYVNMAG